MEVEWSAEIGAAMAHIDIPWRADRDESGIGCEFVDLFRANDLSASVAEIPEARDQPALFRALIRLNGADSPVFTSKCDHWILTEAEIDPYEFDASGRATTGHASYIDFVFRDAPRFTSFEWHDRWVRRITEDLRTQPVRSARVEFVLRQAQVSEAEGFGVTLYAMGCGLDDPSSAASWAGALERSVEAICSLRSSWLRAEATIS